MKSQEMYILKQRRMEMGGMHMVVYFKGEESACINHRDLLIEDIGKVYCTSPEIAHQVEKRKLFRFPKGKNGKEVFSILNILEEIKRIDKTLEVVNLGETDFIVYYKEGKKESKLLQQGKIVFVCMVAFFGAGISIMAYNNDVGLGELFGKVYEWLTGKEHQGPGLLEFFYSVGLSVGIIVFFNHAAKKTLSDDPTPFEVQMRMYERDVNDTFIIGADRKEEEHENH
ncbi:MAG: stage V sporulation protein AA [Lachnospiraceae bacterium]|nr:stage V sporulation protein AA [Lachnospiraceae bacterium]